MVKSARVRAETRIEKFSLFNAKFTTLGGNITSSIRCTVPFVVSISVVIGEAEPLKLPRLSRQFAMQWPQSESECANK